MHKWMLFGCLFLTGCNLYVAGAPKGMTDIIAHRGASAYAPENTMIAFERAVAMETHWFELDCTLTKDGEVVVIHDDTIDRTAGKPGKVADLTLAELKEYDVGTWFDPKFSSQRIPTLGEALDLGRLRGVGVYVEVKNSDDDAKLLEELLELGKSGGALLPDRGAEVMELIEASGSRNLELTRKVIALIREHRAVRGAVIQSFSPVVCAIALVEAPKIRTDLLASSSDKDPEQWDRYLKWLDLLNPKGFNINDADFTEELLERLHADGKEMAVWTVNDRDRMEELIGLGVDGIITDKPDTGMLAIWPERWQGKDLEEEDSE